jgi:hypothetical protein
MLTTLQHLAAQLLSAVVRLIEEAVSPALSAQLNLVMQMVGSWSFIDTGILFNCFARLQALASVSLWRPSAMTTTSRRTGSVVVASLKLWYVD